MEAGEPLLHSTERDFVMFSGTIAGKRGERLLGCKCTESSRAMAGTKKNDRADESRGSY